MHGLSPYPPMQQQQIQVNENIPAYKVIEKRGFFDDNDHLWPKDSLIYWEGDPNPGFEPLNELAEEKLREYFMMLDQKADEVCKAKGTGHASLVNAYESRRRLQQMDRKFERSVDIEEDFPILQARNKEKRAAKSIFDVRATPMTNTKPRYSSRVKDKSSEGKA